DAGKMSYTVEEVGMDAHDVKTFSDVELVVGQRMVTDIKSVIKDNRLHIVDENGKILKEILDDETKLNDADDKVQPVASSNDAAPKHVKLPDSYVGGQKDYEFKNKYFLSANGIFKYVTDNKKAVTVNKAGVLKAKKSSGGPMKIYAMSEAGESISSCSITILDKPKLRFKSRSFTTADIGQIFDAYDFFTTASTRETAADYWTSSNPSVADIDNITGEITIKGKGKTKIIAFFGERGKRGTKKVKATLKVK
ncbi:MAG: hypothetical protein IJU87_07515, partial [Lachnospiraceae bacterium]|nr:hypothetical protein [Lachnospiraceae bacterium]